MYKYEKTVHHNYALYHLQFSASHNVRELSQPGYTPVIPLTFPAFGL